MEILCPPSSTKIDKIEMGHGSGGRQTQQLLEEIFYPAFSNGALLQKHDAAALTLDGTALALTTDSFVVRPLFFPGGDIGRLAVTGTINDLAMGGAQPLWLTAGFIIEEGFDIPTLKKIVGSMADTARQAAVAIVAGDTKVVDRGKGDGVYINTAGVGRRVFTSPIGPNAVKPGDAVILSGDIGRHGLAVLSAREGLGLESDLKTDCAPLWPEVERLKDLPVHCLRDLTRGGLASALNEIAAEAKVTITIEDRAVPVIDAVASACEVLGLDPYYAANEGRFVAFVPSGQAEETLKALNTISPEPREIGRVIEGPARVTRLNTLGTERILDWLYGEPMPRIC